MNTFKEQCITLRKKDFTLNEIMEITGRSKTSVYFHIKNIQLSIQKQKEISSKSRQQALKNSARRKGIALRPFQPFSGWTPDRVLLVAHLMFDGEILKHKCIYHNRSKYLINRVKVLAKEVYEFKGFERMDSISGVNTIAYHNVELAKFLNQKAHELLSEIRDMPITHQKEFIRAFYDDEGCMDVRLDRNLRRVRGYQKDKEILKLIQRLLKSFDIKSKLQGKNEVVITGKSNLIQFQKEINFSKGVRLNPKRANSIWKKPIEKRELLEIAITSFKK